MMIVVVPRLERPLMPSLVDIPPPASTPAPVEHVVTATLQELFSSIQGEGVYVGKRQVFVRFNGCHLACRYCDTPAQAGTWPCRVEPLRGTGETVLLENPMSVETALTWITTLLHQAPHHSVSLTGGEPLLYTGFLKALLPPLHGTIPLYLETSATQPDRLADVLPWVDIIAMDVKLPSATGEPWFLAEQQAFYRMGSVRDLFVKLVVAETTSVEELLQVRSIVSCADTPMVIQPVTPLTSADPPVRPQTLLTLSEALSGFYTDVRVIPQTHKMLSLR